MKKLVIHGGVHRTGTTALQKLLSDNRGRLEASGYSYPGSADNHQEWAWDLHLGRRNAEDFRSFLSIGTRETVIVSAEDFCIHKNITWLDTLRPVFDHIEVHFVLRRQDEWLVSWYNQHVRWPFDRTKSTMTPMEFLGTIDDYYWLDYHWLGRTWSGILGAENVHMYSFGRNVLEQLAQALCPTGELELSSERLNDSVAPELLEILRHLDLWALRQGQRWKLQQALQSLSSGSGISGSIYPPAILRMIVERFGAKNQLAFKEFCRTGEANFDTTVPDRAFYQPSLPDSETLLKEYIAPLLRKLIT